MNLDDMPIDQLDGLLDDLDAERQAVKERGREIMAVRNRRIAEDNAAAHGLMAEQYADVKRQAAEGGKPLLAALNEARREGMRQLQAARAGTAQVGTKAQGV